MEEEARTETEAKTKVKIANIVVKAVFAGGSVRGKDRKVVRIGLPKPESRERNITGVLVAHKKEPLCTITISGIKKFEEIEEVIKAIEKRGEAGSCRGYEIVNIVATFKAGRSVDLESLASALENARCDLERFPGVIIDVSDKVRGVVFSTGHVNIAGARSMAEVEEARRHLLKLVSLWG